MNTKRNLEFPGRKAGNRALTKWYFLDEFKKFQRHNGISVKEISEKTDYGTSAYNSLIYKTDDESRHPNLKMIVNIIHAKFDGVDKSRYPLRRPFNWVRPLLFKDKTDYEEELEARLADMRKVIERNKFLEKVIDEMARGETKELVEKIAALESNIETMLNASQNGQHSE